MHCIQRFISRLILRFLARHGYSVVTTDSLLLVSNTLDGTAGFCSRSGYLRGSLRTRAGRHAEQKIMKGVCSARLALVDGVVSAV